MTALINRIRRQEDEGSALILALLVVLLVGALLAAVLQYQGAGFALAPQMRDDRNETNYAQGAVEGAINQIRGSSEYGREGQPCPSFTPPTGTGLPGVDGKAFRVDCQGLPSTSTTADDAPRFAIHTLGTGSDGIRMTGNNLLYIDGGIYSNGVISVDNQAGNLMRVNGSVNAGGSCTGNIVTTDRTGLHCSPALMAAGDPGYAPAIANQTALQSIITAGALDENADPVPTCGANRIVFQPGYYGLSPTQLLQQLGCGGNGKLWEFRPGLYYFDYTGNWEVKGYQVVGGTVRAGQTASSPLGGACVETSPGVQFVFGGSGTITSQSSAGSTVSGIELCGPPAGHSYPGSPQRIVVYGLSGANTATTSESGPGGPQAAEASVDPAPSPNNAWLNPAGARTINTTDVATTVGALTAFTEKKTATLTYALPSNAVPKGAKVTNVQLRVAHTLVNARAQVTLSAPRLGSTPSFSFDQESCTEATPCTTDITGALSGGADTLWRTIDNLTLTYAATAKNDTGGSVNPHAAVVDGIDLQVTYTTPTYRQQTCATGCTFFNSTSNPNIFMHGTVDTPLAGWAVAIHNDGESIFDRGVIMRTIDIDASASSKQTSSPFRLPKGAPGTRYVYFRGYVDGVEKLRACVEYTDTAPMPNGTTTAAYYGYDVNVRRWLFMRTPSAQGSSC